MNVKVSGLGADPKKLAVLGVLLAVAAYFYFSGSSVPESSVSQSHPSGNLGPATSPRTAVRPGARALRGQGKTFRNAGGEFKPSLKPKDEQLDRSSIDPTLHLDKLAKLQSVKLEGGSRSVFAFGEAAAPAAVLTAKEPKPIIPTKHLVGPVPPPPPPAPVVAEKPKAPPIPLKFYGFVNQTKAGVKRAFFLDGDDIFVASEGQVVKNRYKIVRIGVNSAIVADTQFENSQQTLPLVEEITG